METKTNYWNQVKALNGDGMLLYKRICRSIDETITAKNEFKEFSCVAIIKSSRSQFSEVRTEAGWILV